MNVREVLLKQLDLKLAIWRQANQEAPRPKQGWVRTIRKALGMTIAQLAKRLAVDPSRVVAIEMAEPKDAITIKSLREVADAMECEFIYALVPRKSLHSMLKGRARNIAKKRVQRISHSMALEDQAVFKDAQEEIEELIRLLLSKPRLLNSLWDTQEIKIPSQMKLGRRRKLKG